MAHPKKLDLVGVAEVREILGVSRQRVHQIVRDHPDFPEEVADLAAGKIWYRSEIVQWAKQRSERGNVGKEASKSGGRRRG